MHFKTAASVAVLACAAHVSAREANKPYKLTSMSIPGLSFARRDTNGYHPEQSTCHDGNNCADACGSGYIQCPSNDDNTHCFNPTAHESCCSDGSGNSCDAGYYCSHDHSLNTWCCPENMNLDECARVYSVSGGLESVAAAQFASSTTAGPSSTTAAASSTSTTQAPTSSAETSSSKAESTSAGTSADTSAGTSQGQTATSAGATSTHAGTTAATSGATNSETTSATSTGDETAATSAGDKATAAPTGSPAGSTKFGDAVVPTTRADISRSALASGTGALPPLQTTNGAGVAATSSLGLLLAFAGVVALL